MAGHSVHDHLLCCRHCQHLRFSYPPPDHCVLRSRSGLRVPDTFHRGAAATPHLPYLQHVRCRHPQDLDQLPPRRRLRRHGRPPIPQHPRRQHESNCCRCLPRAHGHLLPARRHQGSGLCWKQDAWWAGRCPDDCVEEGLGAHTGATRIEKAPKRDELSTSPLSVWQWWIRRGARFGETKGRTVMHMGAAVRRKTAGVDRLLFKQLIAWGFGVLSRPVRVERPCLPSYE